MTILSDFTKSLRQGPFRKNTLFFSEYHNSRQVKILLILKKISYISLSNMVKKQCLQISKKDCLEITRNRGKTFCVISIYIAGSNVKTEIDCNSSELNLFKRKGIKEARTFWKE